MSAGSIARALALAGSRRRMAATFRPRSEGRAAFVARAWISIYQARDLRRAGAA